jgi:hypothetical protein
MHTLKRVAFLACVVASTVDVAIHGARSMLAHGFQWQLIAALLSLTECVYTVEGSNSPLPEIISV